MIGYEPIVDQMVVVDGQDLIHYFQVTADSPLPPGTVVVLKIYDRHHVGQVGAWPAMLVEQGGAQVQITADDLEQVPDGAGFRVYISYLGAQMVCWYRGRVFRRA